MKFRKIVCLGFSEEEFAPVEWKQLDKLTEKRILTSKMETWGGNLDTDCLLVKLGAKVDKGLIDNLPNLKYIGMFGTGYGGIDAEYAAHKGIVVTNIADYATAGVAEFTFAILLEHLRAISKANYQAKNRNYTDKGFIGQEIKNKKFGVIGLGAIGQKTALLAQAFGADVQYWSRTRKVEVEKKGITYRDLTIILSTSHIITLNLALNLNTKNFINRARLTMIQEGAILINPSPMELIDFTALTNRLNKNDITFILDHSDEMSKEQLELLRPLKNCVIYPPIAYLTTEASQLKKRIYIDNIKNFLVDKPTNKVI